MHTNFGSTNRSCDCVTESDVCDLNVFPTSSSAVLVLAIGNTNPSCICDFGDRFLKKKRQKPMSYQKFIYNQQINFFFFCV